MKFIRILLFPISVIYGLVTFIRNKLYDFGWYKSTSFDFPIISVGNLSVGGTGKSPHIEYLIRLLGDDNKIATLSRGYGRSTKGFFIADKFTDARDIGDEPMQFHLKFPDISVAVDVNRVEGVKALLEDDNKSELILLDDAFQHRKIKPGLQILLTSYSDLFSDDYMLPTGNLREYSYGKSRADAVVVTRCPEEIDSARKDEIRNKLGVEEGKLFFSSIIYGSVVFGWDKILEFEELIEYKVLLVTGIANPKSLLSYLDKSDIDYKHLKYPDHHNFSDVDILNIKSNLQALGSGKRIILTTEKDYVRLSLTSIHNSNLMYLPISIDFFEKDKEKFNNVITSYVRENKRDS